jgi:hypothetical protein
MAVCGDGEVVASHWVTAEINLDSKTITIYDSCLSVYAKLHRKWFKVGAYPFYAIHFD